MKHGLKIVFCLTVVYGSSALAANVVSIYQLLGNPERYDDKTLVVTGILGVVNEKMVSLFPDAQSREAKITINSILLSGEFGDGAVGKMSAADIRKLDGKLVTVWGTFGYSDVSNRQYTGGVRDVTDIQQYVKYPAYSTKALDSK